MLNPSPNLPKEGVDYTLLPHPSDDQAYAVRIQSGPFEGLMYMYFSVTVKEKDDEAFLSYTTDILEGNVPETAESEFHQLTADVLHAIINNFLDEHPEGIKYKDENGQELGDAGSPTSG